MGQAIIDLVRDTYLGKKVEFEIEDGIIIGEVIAVNHYDFTVNEMKVPIIEFSIFGYSVEFIISLTEQIKVI